jgi:hypothetical protein
LALHRAAQLSDTLGDQIGMLACHLGDLVEQFMQADES